MRTRLIVLCAAAAIAGPVAWAQGSTYFGVSAGFPLLASGHWGFVDLLGVGADLRLDFSGALIGSFDGALFAGVVGANAIQRMVDPDGGRFTPYVGGGVGVAYLGVAGGGESLGAFAALLNTLAGIEYRMGGSSLFVELRGTGIVGFGAEGADFLPVIGVAVGVNFPQ